MRLNDMRFPHVPDTKHQTELTLSEANHSVARVQQCLGPFFRSRELGEYDSNLKLDETEFYDVAAPRTYSLDKNP